MTDTSEPGDVSLPADLTETLEEIWETEKGDEEVRERITGRPRVLHYYEWAVEMRAKHEPEESKHWFWGPKVRYADGRDPGLYAYAQRCIELVDAFSELAEPWLDENMMREGHVIAEVMKELIKEESGEAVDMIDLKARLEVLCEISERYAKDLS